MNIIKGNPGETKLAHTVKLDKGADHAGAESALLARWNVVGHMGGWTTGFAIFRPMRFRCWFELAAGGVVVVELEYMGVVVV